MKKALLLLLSLILCFTLVACGENNAPVEENNDNVNLPNEEINDIVTPEDDVEEIIPGDDIVEEISGDIVEEVSGDTVEEVSGEIIPEVEISGEMVAESGEAIAE